MVIEYINGLQFGKYYLDIEFSKTTSREHFKNSVQTCYCEGIFNRRSVNYSMEALRANDRAETTKITTSFSEVDKNAATTTTTNTTALITRTTITTTNATEEKDDNTNNVRAVREKEVEVAWMQEMLKLKEAWKSERIIAQFLLRCYLLFLHNFYCVVINYVCIRQFH